MKRWLFAGLVGSAACVAWLVSCVSDDTSGPPQGADGGACFANNTCNSGLTCVLTSGVGECVPASDAAPPNDASPQDGGIKDSAIVDAPPTCDATIDAISFTDQCGNPSSGANWTCYNAGDAAYGCQQTFGGLSCSKGGYTSWFQASCLGEYQADTVCCMFDASVTLDTCPPTLNAVGNETVWASTSFCANQTILCEDSAPCVAVHGDASTCVPVRFGGVPALANASTGVCVP